MLEHKKVMVISSHCLERNYEITLAGGSVKRVEELVGKEFELLTLDENEDIVKAKAKAYWNGVDPIYKVTTESGRVIPCNAIHPLWKAEIEKSSGKATEVTPHGWTKTGDLKVGDYLAVTSELPAFGVDEVDENEIKFVAYAVGMRKHSLDDKLPAGKNIPEHFFTLKKELLRLFLNRLFSTDGWYHDSEIEHKRHSTGTVEVGFCSLSEKLVRQVSSLCLRFGVNGKVEYRENVNAWIWGCNEDSEVLNFINEIGIYGKEKKGELVKERCLLNRNRTYRTLKAPRNTHWEKIKSIEIIKTEKTVNIEVEKYHTFLTQFYEKNSSGKCVAAKDHIYLSDGRRVIAEDLVGKDFNLLTYDPVEEGIIEVDAIADWNKYETVYRIETVSGRSIERNSKHPLKVINNGREDWAEVQNLERNSEIKVINYFPSEGNLHLTWNEIKEKFDLIKVERSLPLDIWEWDDRTLRCFLSIVLKSGKQKNNEFIFFGREEVVRGICHLFTRVGIFATLRKEKNWVLSLSNEEKDKANKEIWGEVRIDKDIFRWDRVKSVTKLPPQMTVAIEVPKYHTYFTDFYEHNSYIGAAAACWNFDAFGVSTTLTTGPTKESVDDTIWGAIRSHRRKLPEEERHLFPSASRMETSEDHFATGLVAAKEQAFRGRKSPHMMMVFDECDGIATPFWNATRGMLIAENAIWLAFCNPVDITSQAKREWDLRNFHNIQISALEHPNVIADLLGVPKPYEIDMNLAWVNDWIKRGCVPVSREAFKGGDFQWPPKAVNWEGEWVEIPSEGEVFWRPMGSVGVEFESRVLGRWPSNSGMSIFTEAMWELALEKREIEDAPIEIGIDQAGQGKDLTTFVVRRGRTALHIEGQHGWNSPMIADRARKLASDWTHGIEGYNPKEVKIRIDTTLHNGAYDLKEDWNFISVKSSSSALNKKEYRNRRSELWFNASEMANKIELNEVGNPISGIDVSRISGGEYKEEGARLKTQLTSCRFFIRAGNIKEAEPKDALQKRLGESPDFADAFNLAFAPYDEITEGSTETIFSYAAVDKLKRAFGKRHRT